MRINTIADRVLELMVPKATAQAAKCTPWLFTQACTGAACRNHIQWVQNCFWPDASCRYGCGACYATSVPC